MAAAARRGRGGAGALAVPSAVVLAFLFLPLLAIFAHVPPARLVALLAQPQARDALRLSLETTLAALAVSVALGTPLAYRLARSRGRLAGVLDAALQLPVVVPPAVAGVGLLLVFGRAGWLGPALARAGVSVPFTPLAVVLAQVFTGAPFFILAAREAFASVDASLVDVARTLGSPPIAAFRRVTLPLAASGLLSGAALCWARSLGEFGATMLFAGSYPGRTQTLPLAIYAALDADVDTAVAMSALLLATAFTLLAAVRLVRRRA